MNLRTIGFFRIIFLAAILLVFSCKDQESKTSDENKAGKSSEMDEHYEQLVEMEKETFLKDARKSIEEANMRIEEFEANLYKYNELLTREMQSKINDLKAERDTVEMIVEEISDKSEDNWSDLNDKVREDLEELERAIRSYYNDYMN